MASTSEGEPGQSISFDDLVQRGVELLDRTANWNTSDGVALAGIGYAILAHATAVREQRALPDQASESA